ncbi:MAG: hypothetical protein Q9169_000323 [Polycauliona sp. 2 TL-2023]
MTDDRRIDLNYGHFGEPVYDLESPPKFLPLGQTRTLISSQPSVLTHPIAQTSLQRAQSISKLIQHFPELTPSSAFLLSSVETLGVDRESPADHNQALSERVVFARALHPGHHRNNPSTVPVVAFAGGAAGELVRVVRLTPETLGLDGATTPEFKGEVFHPRLQGLWHTSHGPVQQLQCANALDKPTEWLAVRHGGATSILRIIMRETEVPTLYRIPYVPLLGADVELRIELEHVMVLPVQSSGDSFQTDIHFNPWQPLEIAVLDQSSRWKVWNIKNINKHTKVWTAVAGSSGHVTKDAPDDANESTEEIGTKNYDGWGAIRFVCEGNYLVVCSRKRLACFGLRGQPASFQCPELGLNTSADWILDVRHVSIQSEYIFMTTSSRIFGIHLASEHVENTEQPRLSAKILLAWRHFRNKEDVSLSTQILSLPPRLPRSLRRARPPRSSYRLPDNFIIPNGLLDDDAQEWPFQTVDSSIQDSTGQSNNQHRRVSFQKDQWTINFEWLSECIRPQVAPLLDECLQLVLSRLGIDDHLAGQRLASLEEMIGQEVTVKDADEGSTALEDFFSGVENRQAAAQADSFMVSRLTVPSLSPTLHNLVESSLSQGYHALEALWTTSLPAGVPRRTQTATERSVRLIATQLQLAGNGMCRLPTQGQPEEENTRTNDMRALTLTLPVRQAGGRSDEAPKGIPKHMTGPRSVFKDEEFVPAATLPTPEPTPSLRSHGSRSSVGSSEDSEDAGRRTLYRGGQVAMGILSQWSLGREPDDKDWEAGDTGDGPDDVPKVVVGIQGKRKRRDRERKARAQDADAEGPSSQDMPPRLAASQDDKATHGPGSSQLASMTMSQPQRGRHGGTSRSKKARKAGFR